MTDDATDRLEPPTVEGIDEANRSAAPRYAFARLQLTPNGAKPLIQEVLVGMEPLNRAEICKRIAMLHLARGGTLTEGLPLKVKKALADLKNTKKILGVGDRHYIVTDHNQSDNMLHVLEDVDQNDTIDNDSDIDEELVSESSVTISSASSVVSLQAESEIGDGLEKVYVYFFANDRALSYFEKRDYWPCKVGHTTTSVADRILGQGVTAMHSLPIVGLVIHTNNASQVEKLVHGALRLADRQVKSSARIGSEWFNTTPDAVKTWYSAFMTTLPLLNGAATPGTYDEN